MARGFAKVSEEEIEEAFFYPSDLVNTKTTIPHRVGEERWIYTSTLRVSVYIHHYSPPLRGIVVYLTVILRGRAGYELIYITNEAVGRVGYYQLISGKSEKNNCFSKFSSNSLLRVEPPQIMKFSLPTTPRNTFFRPPKFQHKKFAISFSLFGQS